VARIVVIGNAASGKSTLAKHLARRRELPHFDVDHLMWDDLGLRLTSERDYARNHAQIVTKDCWVIDGLGRRDSIAKRLVRATEIILIDMPLWMHFWLATERERAWARKPLDAVPTFPYRLPPTREVFETMWEIDRTWMPDIRAMCAEAELEGKSLITLSGVKEIDAFVRAV
jgi:adenylate kinase family enzyme